MGIVSEYLTTIIAREIAAHKIIMWYDADPNFAKFIESTQFADAQVAGFGDTFLLRETKFASPLAVISPRRCWFYVPLDQARNHDALVEAEAPGMVISPSLAQIALEALTLYVGARNAAAIEKEVLAGKLTL